MAWLVHFLYLKQKSREGAKNSNHATNVNNSGNHYLALLAACKKNNAELALQLVLPWLRQLLAINKSELDINNIAQAQEIIQEQSFATALNDLQQHLYGKSAIEGAPSWQGSALLTAIQIVHKQQSEVVNTPQILPLNP